MKKLIALFSAIAISTAVEAQIPNADFENWTNAGSYYTPDNWANLNSITNPASVYTCMKGNPGVSGSSFIKLTSKTVAGTLVAPGVAVSGLIDTAAYTAKSGFPFTQRPGNLTGSWQYMGFSGDVGYISVYLSKWNVAMSMRDTVAFTSQPLTGMVMSWETFSIPLSYHSTATPDSAIIVLSASGSIPVNNSYLYVDNLAFSGFPTAVHNVTAEAAGISVYPNPASGIAYVTYHGKANTALQVSVNDLSGRCLIRSSAQAAAGNIPLNIASLATGIYLVTVSDGEHTSIEKIVVQ